MTIETKVMSATADETAPDGSGVFLGLTRPGGGLAQFRLGAGQCSLAVRHRTVDEIWMFIGGSGVMWLRDADGEQTIEVRAGVCVAIPQGTHFQFRAGDDAPLTAVAVTMPPWPGDGEAIRAAGKWTDTVPPGPGLADS